MGQYYQIVNIDKREFLDPHQFGDGLKLLEFACSRYGILTGLAILLANSNGRGGGDLMAADKDVAGRWAGDRIVVAGDYAEVTDPGERGEVTHYKRISEEKYRDVSKWVLQEMMKDQWLAKALRERAGEGFAGGPYLDEDVGAIGPYKPGGDR